MSARSRFRGWLIVLLAIPTLIGVACNLGVAPTTPTPRVPPTSSVQPTVSIQAPQNGADAVVGQPITVQASGSHPDGVTRLELRANGQQVDSKVSQNAAGDQQFGAYLNYTPSVAGTLVLQVIAYRGNVASDPAGVTVSVKTQEAYVTATVAVPIGSTEVIYTDPTCRARVEVNGLNFRQGPGQTYPPYAVLSLGSLITVTGSNADLTWWQGTVGNTTGWVSRNYITLLGSLCSSIPVVSAPPSPAPTLTSTVGVTTAPQATATAGVPDLVIVKIEGPVSIMLDQNGSATATYKVTAQNTGQAAAGAFNLGLVLPDGSLRDMGSVPALAIGQQAVFQTNVTFSSPGAARLSAVADTNNTVAESDETNNIKTLDLVLIKPTATSP